MALTSPVLSIQRIADSVNIPILECSRVDGERSDPELDKSCSRAGENTSRYKVYSHQEISFDMFDLRKKTINGQSNEKNKWTH